jgi:hypothetical protein
MHNKICNTLGNLLADMCDEYTSVGLCNLCGGGIVLLSSCVLVLVVAVIVTIGEWSFRLVSIQAILMFHARLQVALFQSALQVKIKICCLTYT